MNKSILTREQISDTISDLLTDICDSSSIKSEINQNNNSISCFLSKKVPKITIKDYFDRIIKYSKIEISTIIIILIYVDRLCDSQHIRLNYYNIHKLLLASLILAIKYNEDDYYENKFYSKVGGVTKKEMDKLEYEFLCLVDFNLFINEDLYTKYQTYLSSIDVNTITE